MAREKECYRDNLQRLDERFPDKEILTVSDVAAWTGLDRRTVTRLYGDRFMGKKHKCKYISKADLARAVSSSGGY